MLVRSRGYKMLDFVELYLPDRTLGMIRESYENGGVMGACDLDACLPFRGDFI